MQFKQYHQILNTARELVQLKIAQKHRYLKKDILTAWKTVVMETIHKKKTLEVMKKRYIKTRLFQKWQCAKSQALDMKRKEKIAKSFRDRHRKEAVFFKLKSLHKKTKTLSKLRVSVETSLKSKRRESSFLAWHQLLCNRVRDRREVCFTMEPYALPRFNRTK